MYFMFAEGGLGFESRTSSAPAAEMSADDGGARLFVAHRSLIPPDVEPTQHKPGADGSGGSVEKLRIPEKGLGPTAFTACTRTLCW